MPYAKGTPYWIGSRPPTRKHLERDDRTEAALAALEAAYRNNVRGVVLHGKPGTGKTTVLQSWADPWLAAPLPAVTWRTRAPWLDRQALWASAADLIDDIRGEINLGKRLHHEDDADSFAASGIARLVPMLFIDDLGTESTSEFSRSAIESLIDARYRDRETKQTWFTTNLDGGELLQRYSERTLSRLVELCEFHELTGEDRRMRRFA